MPEYYTEEDPKTPTNVPEMLEDEAHKTFTYTRRTSGSGCTEYIKPQVEEGYPDYPLMLDLMKMVPGAVFETSGKIFVVVSRKDCWTNWGDRYKVENGCIEAVVIDVDDDKFVSVGEKRKFEPSEEYQSPLSLWEKYIHGKLTVHGGAESVVGE